MLDDKLERPIEPDIIRGIDKPDIGSSDNNQIIIPPPAPKPSTKPDKN